jgi:hypothetical protein
MSVAFDAPFDARVDTVHYVSSSVVAFRARVSRWYFRSL